MKKIAFILLSLVLVGCGTYVTKEEFAPNMYKDHPQTIVVLPPMNKSTSAEAKEYYTTTIAEPLTQSGYYVYPLEVVNDVLKQEGLYDTETMLAVPPQKFREFFGADAVLYLTILEWNTSYMITSGSVTVKVAYELKSTSTGDVIWFYDDAVTVNTSGDSGNLGGWAGLLAKAITTAIKTAATDYVPIAKEANEKILLAIPFGKYHKQYNADMKIKVEKKKALKPEEENQKKNPS
jgi:hypothetical protein